MIAEVIYRHPDQWKIAADELQHPTYHSFGNGGGLACACGVGWTVGSGSAR
jgi:hypothetical protein